ncbi:Protein tssc1 [Coemansia javaensis]|uniref:Protein tssc1 n=1 Tax=Coemansia javaensis TaxID=2761396 RepID=A0A9W8H9M1_9FUNG|nr:Protein tssc1 [Coemansia javaensis]
MEASHGASHVYGIERHTLCLAPVVADAARNRFVLGTLGITEPSEIHLVDFDSDRGALHGLVYRHPCGVRALASVPWDPAQLLVVGSGTGPPGAPPAALVALPDVPEDMAPGAGGLERATAHVAPLGVAPPEDQPLPHAVVCHPAAHCREAATVSGASVQIWDFAPAGPTAAHAIAAARHAMDDIEAAAWHPADPARLATADGMCVRAWDTRAEPRRQQTAVIEYAHSGKARCLDFNPNLPYMLATGGDDGSVRIWDMRSPSAAVVDIANHTHWVYSVAFNPGHDQLLLSAGGDGLVNLERAAAVSSAQVISAQDSDAKGSDSDSDSPAAGAGAADGLVAQFDDHETSVYATRWSAGDSWIFASLSFGGRMVINAVPQEEKYKILL